MIQAGRLHKRISTQEILGQEKPRLFIVDGQWAKHARDLRQLRESLLRARSAQGKQAREEAFLFREDVAEEGNDSFDRDCALALLSSCQNMLYEIEEALNRIENGTYGICEATGKPIEPARLKAIPWTRFSIEAQTALERRERHT